MANAISVQHSKERSTGSHKKRQESHSHLHHPCPRRSLLWSEDCSRQVPERKGVRNCFHRPASKNQIKPDFVRSFWELGFPGQLSSEFVLPEVLEGDTLFLEGQELHVVRLGHTDTANTTALHVPSIGLVVSGDAVYNNTHPFFAECDEKAGGSGSPRSIRLRRCIRRQ
jgi:hypothetical protein